MWGAGSKASNASNAGVEAGEDSDLDNASVALTRRSFLPPSMLMALNQQSNDVLSSINFDGVISNYIETVQSDKGIDCSMVLTHHIIDCMFALKNILKVQKNAASTPEELAELDLKAPSALYNGCLPELGGLVLSTVSNPWTEDQMRILNSYHSLSEQVMHCFPEIFNKSSKATGNTLMHTTCRHVAPVASEMATKMIMAHSPKLATHPNNRNQYPLHMAMRNKNTTMNVVRTLIKGNEGVASIPDESGLLPLHFAVMTENSMTMSFEVVEYVLRQDTSAAGVQCKLGRLPLHLAINTIIPSVPVINLLLKNFPEGCHTPCANGWLPIHRLVTQSQVSLEVMKIFKQPQFKSCFEVMTTKGGQLPIHIYCDQPAPSEVIVLSLIEASPHSVCVTDKFHYTPLTIVIDNKEPCYEIAKLLLYGSYGKDLACIGVPYNLKGKPTEYPHVDENTKMLFPLHFLVGMNEVVNVEIVTIVAAMFPEAINKEGITKGAYAWSPYLKAKERNLKDLLVVFDMILEVDSYRNGIIQQFNENYSIQHEMLIKQLDDEESKVSVLDNNTNRMLSSPQDNSSVASNNIKLPKLNVNGAKNGVLLPPLTVTSNVKTNIQKLGEDSGSETNLNKGVLNDFDSDDLSLSSFTTIKTTKTTKIKAKPLMTPLFSSPANSSGNVEMKNMNINSNNNNNTGGNLSDVINDAMSTQKHTRVIGLNDKNNRPSADVNLHTYLRPQQDHFDDRVTDIVLEKYNNKKTMVSQMRGDVKAVIAANKYHAFEHVDDDTYDDMSKTSAARRRLQSSGNNNMSTPGGKGLSGLGMGALGSMGNRSVVSTPNSRSSQRNNTYLDEIV